MIQKYFTMNADIQRCYSTSDDAGGFSLEWLSIMTSKGRLDGIAGETPFYAQKKNPDSTHVWICGPFELTIEDPSDQTRYFGAPFAMLASGSLIPTDIAESDRLMISGIPYRMTWIDDPMNYARHLEIELKRWSNDG